MIKAIVSDIGGVILRTVDQSGRKRLEKRYNLPPGGVDKLVFDSKPAKDSTIGLVEETSVWENVAKVLSLTSEELDQFKSDFWSGDQVDDKLISFLKSMREYYTTALLSNAWKNFRSVLADGFNIIEGETVDHLLISSEVGIAKPDPQIYRILSDKINCQYNEILFIDDFIENIVAADTLGINTIHYRDGMDLINEIKLELK
jgi:HAD superfamily hydrolase (TIGR01509 family)